MNDEHTDVVIQGGGMVEITAEPIARIIFDTCHTTEALAIRAANDIIDYLIAVHSNPSQPQ